MPVRSAAMYKMDKLMGNKYKDKKGTGQHKAKLIFKIKLTKKNISDELINLSQTRTDNCSIINMLIYQF